MVVPILIGMRNRRYDKYDDPPVLLILCVLFMGSLIISTMTFIRNSDPEYQPSDEDMSEFKQSIVYTIILFSLTIFACIHDVFNKLSDYKK